MNFDFSEEHKLLQETIREFCQGEISPQAKQFEDNHEFPAPLINKLAGLGFMGMSVPEKYGGIKTDLLSNIIVIEEISRVMPSLGVIFSVHTSLFCYALNQFGTEEQKKKYLTRAASGELLGAFSLTEPNAGSDATNLLTTAERKGDEYILNGTKAWVTNGQNAGAIIVLAKQKEASTEGKKRLSAFIVDSDTPGFKVTKIEEKMGLHASPTAEISLENCRVPARNRLGEEGQGARIAFHCLDISRIGIAAQAVGLSQRALEEALRYAHQREAFQKRLADFQAIQFMLADMATQIEAARWLTYKAANYYDRGLSFSKESAQAKLLATEIANKVTYLAVQIHGAYGYSREFLVEQLYRDARVLTIYEGTSEIQRLIISRNLLQE
ncbi:acyl-CoA dehydrogenase family protein [Candidatus Aminicenantes bacterium AC-334-K16]|jgi:alkylation response protein AidB-like acyl-CoA dehydrogenase|nr:acyl-CoA dehydrogenase family protein [Candidatus Aminicenantes bacterium AC-334-K16]